MLAVLLVVGAGLFVIVDGKVRAARMAAELAMVRELKCALYCKSQRYQSPVDEKAGWIRLFNGRDSSGWIERLKSGGWQVTGDGVIQLMGEGALFTTKEYDDFHLVAEVRVDGDIDSGIFFRGDPKKLDGMNPSGYEAMINATDQRNPRKGSLTNPLANYVYGEDPMIGSGQWFTYEVIALDSEIALKIDGKTTVTGIYGVADRRSGRIGLQLPGKGSFGFVSQPVDQASSAALDLRGRRRALPEGRRAGQSARRRQSSTPGGDDAALGVIKAEVDVIESKLAVAEAEGNQKERILLFDELLKLTEEEKTLILQIVMRKWRCSPRRWRLKRSWHRSKRASPKRRPMPKEAANDKSSGSVRFGLKSRL